jgi:opacity protein-like surface antigen
MYAIGGGAEYKIWKTLYARVDYEYQWWPQVLSSKTLDPNGYTFGATYYLRGIHRHY